MALDQDVEERRLRELARYLILDTRADEAFDRLCALACHVVGARGGSIGFLDRDRLWLKARTGGDTAELPRAGTFCDAAIRSSGLFEVEDAEADTRFRRFTFPDGAPVRAVAVVPIEVRRGLRIGTVCLFFDRPGSLKPPQREALQQVAAAVVDRLRLHRIRIERRLEAARKRAKDAEVKAQRAELALQRRQWDQTSRLARIGGWEYDVARNHLSWSEGIYRILELDRSFVPVFGEISPFYRPDHRERIIGLIRTALRENQPFETEVPVVTAEGRERWVRFICECEVRRGKVVRLIGTIQDVTDQRATEQTVVYIATHDVMTRLPNRAVFSKQLAEALKVRNQQTRCMTLFLIDIDHFKAVNDTLGHQAGDALLTAVGERLTQAAGPRLVARLGGDEFAILATEALDEPAIDQLADAVMRAFCDPVRYGDESIPVTVSIGIATGRPGDSAEQILKDADIALYEAKGTGRNRAVRFDRGMRDEVELKHAVLRAFRQAIERDELLLHYQPKVSLRTGELLGFEALLRWRRPDGFVVGPSFFMPALEDPQLSLAIGDRVLDIAVRQAADWRAAGFDFGHIAINTATSQFRRGDLADLVGRSLAEAGVPARSLCVEVTENVLLSRDAGNVLSALNALHASGVKIALDDFGTGYASLTHLKEFPVDLLKIDRSFVSSLGDERESRAIVRGITALAHELGIEVIAEGIETALQRDTLRHLGVNYGQGFYFARPVPADVAAAEWLARSGDRRAVS